jgi:hypothetical protein
METLFRTSNLMKALKITVLEVIFALLQLTFLLFSLLFFTTDKELATSGRIILGIKLILIGGANYLFIQFIYKIFEQWNITDKTKYYLYLGNILIAALTIIPLLVFFVKGKI